MLAGIFKLLQLEAKLVVAVMGLVIKAAIWLVDFLTRLIPNKSQQQPVLQPQIITEAPKPAENLPAVTRNVEISPPQPTQPPIHVTVNLPPELGSGPRSKMQAVLANTDHAIYIAGIDDMVAPHPRGPELIGALDKMLFIAAHRNGDPFSLPPELDRSALASEPLPAMTLDTGFDAVEPKPLPPADGRSWMIRAGTGYEVMPTPKVRKRTEPVPISTEEMPENWEFTAGHPRPLPRPDGALWLAAVEQPFRFLSAKTPVPMTTIAEDNA